MSRIFISHASQDSKAAAKLCKLLEKRGIECWIAPRDVPPGSDYADAIMQGIEECTAMVLVLSDGANESIFVKREVEGGVSRRKPVFPVRIRDVEPSASLELFIGSTQWIDAFNPPLEEWVDRLVNAINSLEATKPVATLPKRRGGVYRTLKRTFLVLFSFIVIGLAAWLFVNREAFRVVNPAEVFVENANPAENETQDKETDNSTAPSSEPEKKKPAWSLIRTLSGHNHSVPSIAFNKTGDRLVSGSIDTTVKLWNVDTGECLNTFEPIAKTRGSNEMVSGVAISGDGSQIAAAYGWGVRLWNIGTYELLQRIESKGNRACYAVAFSPDDTLLALPDASIQFWNINDESFDTVLEDSYITGAAVAFNHDGTRVASEGGGNLKIWDTKTEQVRQTIQIEGQNHVRYSDLCFNPSGSLIAASAEIGSGGLVYIWNSVTAEQVHVLSSDNRRINSIAFSPDGKFLVTGGGDWLVTIWDVESGKVIKKLGEEYKDVTSVAFNHDGSQVAAGYQDSKIRIWTTP